jgi:type I restriction enzyme R subunit
LCSSITNKQEQREAAFFEAIRISVNRITAPGKLKKTEINKQIGELLEQSIHSKGVINLFKDFDMGFSLFDPLFIEKIQNMEQKNLSVELLNKLLMDEIKTFSRSDIVKGKDFSERLKQIMKSYRDKMVYNAESLDHFVGLVSEDDGNYKLGATRQALLNLANDIIRLNEENKILGLSKEELSFYHAISNPENISDFYTNKELIDLTQDLTQTISKEMTSDWMMRESGIANMRRTVKRLLADYNYPENHRSDIIDLIVEQAEYFDIGA